MHCPKCKTHKLKQGKVKHKDVVIDYCAKCKGIWLDNGETEELVSDAIKNLTVEGQNRKLSAVCPKCENLLYEFYYPQTFVGIDMCENCKGIWLDAGELKEIQAIRKKMGQTGKAKEYLDPIGVKGALLRFIEKALVDVRTF